MEGFTKNPKIACFKEGGQVGYKSRKNHSESKEMAKDIKQDKAIVKKAVGQHESAKHKGEGKTELKLKSGGRCKKEGGNVRKYKTGGEVIGMKKTAADKKDIAGIKKKGSAPKKAAPKTKQMGMAPAEFPAAGELPAFEYGGSVPVNQGAMSEIDRKLAESERQRKMARTKNAMGAGLTPSQMSQFAGQEMAAEKPGMMGAIKGAINSGVNMGSPMSAKDEERALLKGVTAIGRACGGAI